MIKTIIFDYDGVIVDSFQNVYYMYQKICKEFNKKVPRTIEEFRDLYGYSYLQSYDNMKLSQEQRVRANFIFKNETLKLPLSVFKGIPELLEELSKHYRIGMLSANYKKEIEQKLKENGLRHYFFFVKGVERINEPLRKAIAIPKTLKEYKLKADEVVFIGDRTNDYNNARKAGLRNIIIVEYGWGYDKNKVPKQKFVVNTPLDIIKAVKIMSS